MPQQQKPEAQKSMEQVDLRHRSPESSTEEGEKQTQCERQAKNLARQKHIHPRTARGAIA
jgi:hypothetical protein